MNFMRFVAFYANGLLLIASFLLILGCSIKKSSSFYSQGFAKENVEVGKEDFAGDSAQLIKRANTNLVAISFMEQFNDTLAIYVNKRKVKHIAMFNDNNNFKNPGYVSFDTVFYIKKSITIDLQLINQKKTVKFKIDNQYPFVTIQRFNEIWYVNYRRYIMIIR